MYAREIFSEFMLLNQSFCPCLPNETFHRLICVNILLKFRVPCIILEESLAFQILFEHINSLYIPFGSPTIADFTGIKIVMKEIHFFLFFSNSLPFSKKLIIVFLDSALEDDNKINRRDLCSVNTDVNRNLRE